MTADQRSPSPPARPPAPVEDWPAVAAALNQRLAELRLSQRELAERSGISVATLRVLQHGTGARRARDITLAAIARALGWPPDHLIRVLTADPPLEPPTAKAAAPPNPAPTLARALARNAQPEILAALHRLDLHLSAITQCLALLADHRAGGDRVDQSAPHGTRSTYAAGP